MWHVLANSICGEMHLSLPSLPIDLLEGRGEVDTEGRAFEVSWLLKHPPSPSPQETLTHMHINTKFFFFLFLSALFPRPYFADVVPLQQHTPSTLPCACVCVCVFSKVWAERLGGAEGEPLVQR